MGVLRPKNPLKEPSVWNSDTSRNIKCNKITFSFRSYLIEKWIYVLRHLLNSLVKLHLPTVKICPTKQIVSLIVSHFVLFKTPSDFSVKVTSSTCQNSLTSAYWKVNLCFETPLDCTGSVTSSNCKKNCPPLLILKQFCLL